MTTPTLAEQAAELITETFKDGEAADGAPTAEEQAAHAADQATREAGAAAADAAGDEPGDDTTPGGDTPAADAGDAGAAGEAVEGETPPPPAPDPAAKPAKGKSASDRIGDLTAARRQAERNEAAATERAERAECELAALKSGKTPLTSPSDTDTSVDVPPDPSQFDYGEVDAKYIAALARYETKRTLAADKAEEKTARQAAAADDQRREAVEKQEKMVRAGLELHDDFDEVVMQGAREGKWDLSPHLGPMLLDSEFGPQITYDLAKDPAEAARVAKLSSTDQAKWLGRQEAKFEAAKPSQAGGKTPPKTPQAPPPPRTPRGNSGQFKVGADSNDFAAVEAAWGAGELR